ncbi:MAG TPA: hypothetical protein VH593_16010 [Ktedonobacteraceae bacterium]|jgi:hypothetical protein
MSGMLTIDADEVRTAASGLGNIASQLKNDAEQMMGQLSTLESALHYAENEVSVQMRQAINQLTDVTQLLQTAQARLMQVVNDTLHLEADIDSGRGNNLAGSGPGGSGSGLDGGEEDKKGVQYGGVAPTGKVDSESDDGERVTTIGIGEQGSLVTVPLSEYKNGDFQNDADAQFGTAAIGAGYMMKGGNVYAGIWGSATAASVSDEGSYGSKNLAVTYGGDASALSATGFAGVDDDSVGVDAGVSLVQVDGSVGTNVGGVHVGVTGGIGLSLNLGIEVGKKTEIKLGPFSLGLDFSW